MTLLKILAWMRGFLSRKSGLLRGNSAPSGGFGGGEKERPGFVPGRVVHGSGGGGGTRTPDLYSAIVALSQLSYAPRSEPRSVYGVEGRVVKGDWGGAVDRRHAGAYNRGASGGGNSVGRVPASQAGCRGFESRPPLQPHNHAKIGHSGPDGLDATTQQDTITGTVFPESSTGGRAVAGFRLLLTSWRRHLAAENKAPKTLETYTEAMTLFGRFLVERGMPSDPADITREHVEEFITHLLAQYKPATAANRYRALGTFFRWLVEEGEIAVSPMAKMRPPTVPEEPPAVLTEPNSAGC